MRVAIQEAVEKNASEMACACVCGLDNAAPCSCRIRSCSMRQPAVPTTYLCVNATTPPSCHVYTLQARRDETRDKKEEVKKMQRACVEKKIQTSLPMYLSGNYKLNRTCMVAKWKFKMN